MTILRAVRTAQYPLVAEFIFNYNDGTYPKTSLSAADPDTTRNPPVTDMGSKTTPSGLNSGSVWTASPTGPIYVPIVKLPIGAQIVGGEIDVEVAFAGGAVTLSLGNPDNGTVYASGVDLAAAARTALTPPLQRTGSGATDAALGKDIVGTLTLPATPLIAGRCVVRITYTLVGRANEVMSV